MNYNKWESSLELSLTIPNHSLKYTVNLLTKEMKQGIEDNLKLFDEYKDKLEGEVE